LVAYGWAVVAALRSDGATFHDPLLALGLGSVAAVLLWCVGYAVVWLNLRLFGTDADRAAARPLVRPVRRPDAAAAPASLSPRPSPTAAPTPPAPPPTPTVPRPGFHYEVRQRVQDGTLSLDLGVEQHTGRRYLRTPMPQRDGQYLEFHGLDLTEYEDFRADPAAARVFAARCREDGHRD